MNQTTIDIIPNLLNPIRRLYRFTKAKEVYYKDRITGQVYDRYSAQLLTDAILVDEKGNETVPTLSPIEKPPKKAKKELKSGQGRPKHTDPEYVGKKLLYESLQKDFYLIIKYGNRKLYDTQGRTYLSQPLQSVLALQKSQNKPIKVLHNETRNDITTLVLKIAEHLYGEDGVLTKHKEAYKLFNMAKVNNIKQR